MPELISFRAMAAACRFNASFTWFIPIAVQGVMASHEGSVNPQITHW
jgi:hypothetical protein